LPGWRLCLGCGRAILGASQTTGFSMSQNAALGSQEMVFGHPKGLFVCFFTEMWERFAFYGMKALLFLYLTQHHQFDDASGYLLLGTYAGLAYALPVVGGMLADRYMGMRQAVVLGGVVLALGQLGMAYTGSAAVGIGQAATRDGFAIQIMYLSLALIAVGVGFLKPNISTIVGRLYAENDPRKESGFTLFYMGINIGAMLASLLVADAAKAFGWGAGFALSGILMCVGLAIFLRGQKHFHGHAEPTDPSAMARVMHGLSVKSWIYIGTVLGTLAVWQLLQMKFEFAALSKLLNGHPVTATEIVAVAMGLAFFAWFVRYTLFGPCNRMQSDRMWVLFTLTAVSALFWGLYEQTYGVWVAMAERVTNLDVLNSPLRTWDAENTTFFGGFFVVLMSPLFAVLWPKLDKLGMNPSTPMKFAIALAFCGLSFGVLAYACANPELNGKISGWWIVLAYAVLVVGEMALSPIGLSMVTSLSVGSVVGLMMGVWFLFSAFGEIIAGRLSTFASVQPNADGTFDVAKTLAVYQEFFSNMMWTGLIAAVLLALIVPLLKRGMHLSKTQA
jgi:proton-dependent oligopeptide transporter, POT family